MKINNSTLFNVGIIAACGAVFGFQLLHQLQPLPRSTAVLEPGERVKGVEGLQESGKTLILITASTCHFCTESMTFYRKLSSLARSRGTRLVGVSWESPERNRAYLTSHGVDVDEIVSASKTSIGIRGTPTVILVNSRGVVLNSWPGKLDEPTETEVLNAAMVN